MFYLSFPVGYSSLINPEGKLTTVYQGLVVLFPVGRLVAGLGMVTW
ncbi:hypothetical protein SPWS13_1981 [Shewanella putrefaciens]|nr:hypothetical protein SPWS13_1981 [Shewanella putrefaciens]